MRSLPRPPTEEIQRKISGNAKASDQDQATKPPHRLKPASYHRASSFPRRRKSLFHPKFQIRKMKRSEEHTSELQSLMRISYAVFCLKQKNKRKNTQLILNPQPT